MDPLKTVTAQQSGTSAHIVTDKAATTAAATPATPPPPVPPVRPEAGATHEAPAAAATTYDWRAAMNDPKAPNGAPLKLTPAQVWAMTAPKPPAGPLAETFKPPPGTETPAEKAPGQAFGDTLKANIPGPVKAVVDGVSVPGLPGVVKPRFDKGVGAPTGVDFSLDW